MKKVLFIALLLCGIGWGAKAQTVAVKSNILYDATATVNLGAEVAFNRHWSLDISGNYRLGCCERQVVAALDGAT